MHIFQAHPTNRKRIIEDEPKRSRFSLLDNTTHSSYSTGDVYVPAGVKSRKIEDPKAVPLEDSSKLNAPPCVSFPEIPYYSLGNFLEIAIDTRFAFGDIDISELERQSNIEALHQGVQRIAEEQGGVWFLGSVPLSSEFTFFSTPFHSRVDENEKKGKPQKIQSGLRYEHYVCAMTETYERMSTLRNCAVEMNTSSPVITPHVFYLRIRGHRRLKDIIAMLSVERGQLLLFITASSTLAQEHLTKAAVCAGVDKEEIQWIAGAVLVTESSPHRESSVTVLALWNALTTLPLGDRARGNTSSNTDGIYNWLEDTDALITEADVSLFSSLPIRDGQKFNMNIRLYEVQTVAGGGNLDDTRSQSLKYGHRYLWRLIGPVRIVHPLLFTHLIRTLVETCCIYHFDIRCGYGESSSSISTKQADSANTIGGLQFLQGVPQGVSQLGERGSSTASSLMCCSRLSSHAWISLDERRELGMVETQPSVEDQLDDGAEVCLECEFMLTRVVFTKNEFDCSIEEGNGLLSSSSQHYEYAPPEGWFIRSHKWPSCFQIWKKVTHIVDEVEIHE